MDDLPPHLTDQPERTSAAGERSKRVRMSDPSSEIVLRSTVPSAAPPSEPVRPGENRSVDALRADRTASEERPEAGSGTGRLRPALLDAARRLIAAHGPNISLQQLAEQSGVGEAAVREQFGSISDLLHAVLITEIDLVIATLAHRELGDALTQAAVTLSEHPLLESLSTSAEPVLARMARVDVRLAGWQITAHAVDDALSRAGRRGSPMVLRWLASYLCAPATEDDIRADVDILVSGLPPVATSSPWSALRTG
jgi:AcrR family transcriptional regulator